MRNGDGDDLLTLGTEPNFRTIFVQRLANPKTPWNPMPGDPQHDPRFPVNPYITVDWASTDLTVYNGEDRTGDDPDGISDPMPGNLKFATRQRGKFGPGDQPLNFFTPIAEDAPDVMEQPGSYAFRFNFGHTLGFLNNSDPAGTAPAALRFRREAVQTSATTSSLQYFGDPLFPLPTIWWNNRPFANAMELLQVPSSTPGRFFLEFRANREVTTPPIEFDNYNEFPTLSATRRFYQLLNFFSSYSFNPANNMQRINPATGRPAPGAAFYRLFDYVETPSPFVDTKKWLNTTQFNRPITRGPDSQWGRAMVDDDSNGVTDDFSEAGWPGSDDVNARQDGFRPPFNYVSRQRDPGKVNLNTIPITPAQGPDGEWGFAGIDDNNNMTIDDPAEFGTAAPALRAQGIRPDDLRAGPLEGLLKGFPALDTGRFASKFFMSRRGYHTVARDPMTGAPTGSKGAYGFGGLANPLALDPYYPTRFANPFRPAWATTLLPGPIRQQFASDGLQIAKNQFTDTVLNGTGGPFMDDIQGTLMRRDSLTPTYGADGQPGSAGVDDDMNGQVDDEAEAGVGDDVYRNEPLFVPDTKFEIAGTEPPLATGRWRDQRFNSHQRYLGMQRMANLTSTTSNVYAIWVTVGYFEVEPVLRRKAGGGFEAPESHPDGYRLGRELGSDLGRVRRHRSFYIVDRSVPVAFEPGENHNVDRAILLRRLIQ